MIAEDTEKGDPSEEFSPVDLRPDRLVAIMEAGADSW